MEQLVSDNAFDLKESSDFATFEKELSSLHLLALSHTATACAFRGPLERARERFHSVFALNFL